MKHAMDERTAIRKMGASLRQTFRMAVGTAVCLALVGPSAATAKLGIEHDAVKKSKSGQRIEIQAKIKDKKAGVGEVRAYFKSGYDSRFWFAPMRSNGDQKYLGVLPAPALGAETVEYRIYAVNGADDFVKTQAYTIKIVDDEDALARMQQKEPTDVDIDLDRIEQMRDLARRGGEPNPSTRVEVRNDVPGSNSPSQLPGFQDYIVMADATPAAAGAGLGAAGTVQAGGGFLSPKVLLGGLGGLAVVKFALDESDDEEAHHDEGCCSSSSSSQAATVGSYSNFSHTGGGRPEQVAVDVGKAAGHFFFDYDTQSARVQIRIVHEGRTLFDSGCTATSGNSRRRVDLSGSGSRIAVDVRPNCSGDTSGQRARWSFTVSWPNSQ